ncbi:MAG TPA: hypothetical protein VGP17_13875 [Solirubrobacteraceae bacterium]|nr:hypothetical protein [Solirubrobacteraceae bacterium]
MPTQEPMTNDHKFMLRFLAPGLSADELSVCLYEAVDDVSLMGPDEDGSFLSEFDRCAPTLPAAVACALRDLLRAVPRAIVLRVEADDLATLADIARRCGRTAESVRLLVNGRRGPGGFPPAAGRLDARTRVWRLTDVAAWFDQTLREPIPDTSETAFIQAFNDALEIRRLASSLGGPQRRAVAEALPDGLLAA